MKRPQLSRTLRPEGMNRVPPVDPVKHVSELRRRDSNHAIGRQRPDEAALLKPLGIERHAEPVVPQNLNQVTSGASEDVEIKTCTIGDITKKISPNGEPRPTMKFIVHQRRQGLAAHRHPLRHNWKSFGVLIVEPISSTLTVPREEMPNMVPNFSAALATALSPS